LAGVGGSVLPQFALPKQWATVMLDGGVDDKFQKRSSEVIFGNLW
jgi:hypothetical protein